MLHYPISYLNSSTELWLTYNAHLHFTIEEKEKYYTWVAYLSTGCLTYIPHQKNCVALRWSYQSRLVVHIAFILIKTMQSYFKKQVKSLHFIAYKFDISGKSVETGPQPGALQCDAKTYYIEIDLFGNTVTVKQYNFVLQI